MIAYFNLSSSNYSSLQCHMECSLTRFSKSTNVVRLEDTNITCQTFVGDRYTNTYMYTCVYNGVQHGAFQFQFTKSPLTSLNF